jgi:hypothetical protein
MERSRMETYIRRLQSLAVIAGQGVYPLLLAEAAKQAGVGRVIAVAFKGETDGRIARYADEVKWVRLGQLRQMLDTLRESGARHAVMAGQITPTALFHVRPDKDTLDLLASLKERNAQTIFAAVGDKLKAAGLDLLPAHLFMESHMATAGQLSRRAPSPQERSDIEFGMKVARLTSGLNIGQTVVIREGTIMAVEAFEGTNETIRRAARLCGPGCVVVKVAGPRHDMRFDIPVVGVETIKLLKKVRAGALAVEAGRTILLERQKVVQEADRAGICVVGISQAF